MVRVPENCSFRTSIAAASDTAVCGVVSLVTGVTDPNECFVRRDACEACCKSIREPDQINPVIASLVYTMASRIVTGGGHPECTAERARLLMQRSGDQLSVVVREMPEENFPPRVSDAHSVDLENVGATALPASPRCVVGLLTAPRATPRIEETLDSLGKAGFDDIHIFAEPNAWIPDSHPGTKVTQRDQRLGNFLNFYSCLSTLLTDHPQAEAFAVLQDDIQLATGLKQWLDEQLWPLDNGIVSLFTPRLHSGPSAGWRIVSPGFQRVCGAQALVFRRELLEKFLSDARVLHSLRLRRQCDDAVLGGWLSREGLGIAYHTPSPVQHVGETSSLFANGHDLRNLAHAVKSVAEIADWRLPPSEIGHVGLVGWNVPTGLGSLNRDLAIHLGIKRWLAPPHPELTVQQNVDSVGAEIVTRWSRPDELRQWVEGLDWLLFAERPYVDHLPRIAAHAGVGIACIPMWEWVRPDLRWLQFVDVMICPTQHTCNLMQDWTRRYGFGWKTVYIPWPVDVQRFQFRQRSVCREFLFINGWGGGNAHHPDRSPASYHRKGMELIIAAAELAPDLKFIVRSLKPISFALPKNIRVAKALKDNAGLYDEGDVCVQPSHYEGLGLQLLECQAAGMPLVTTNGPPMNEAHPWRTIPTFGQEVVNVGGGFISSELMTPAAVVETLRPLVGMDIREASRQARARIETERDWATAGRLIRAELVKR